MSHFFHFGLNINIKIFFNFISNTLALKLNYLTLRVDRHAILCGFVFQFEVAFFRKLSTNSAAEIRYTCTCTNPHYIHFLTSNFWRIDFGNLFLSYDVLKEKKQKKTPQPTRQSILFIQNCRYKTGIWSAYMVCFTCGGLSDITWLQQVGNQKRVQWNSRPYSICSLVCCPVCL